MWWECLRSTLLAKLKYITQLLTIVTSLNIWSPELIHLTTVSLGTSSYFPHPQAPGNHHSTLWFHEFEFFFLDSTSEWDHPVFTFLFWLISLSTMSSSFIHVVTNVFSHKKEGNPASTNNFELAFPRGYLGFLGILRLLNNQTKSWALEYPELQTSRAILLPTLTTKPSPV